MEIIKIIFLITITGFVSWSAFNLNYLKKNTKARNQISDDRYYELKYKLQFITSIGTVIIAVAGVLGYGVFEKMIEHATKDMNNKAIEVGNKFNTISQDINSTNDLMNAIDIKIKEHKANLRQNQQVFNKIKTDLDSYNSDLNSYKKNIDSLGGKSPAFFTEELTLNASKNNGVDTIYFKNIKKISGENLPVFKTPPIVNAIPRNTVQIGVYKTTTKYVIVFGGASSYTIEPNKEERNPNFLLMIKEL